MRRSIFEGEWDKYGSTVNDVKSLDDLYMSARPPVSASIDSLHASFYFHRANRPLLESLSGKRTIEMTYEGGWDEYGSTVNDVTSLDRGPRRVRSPPLES